MGREFGNLQGGFSGGRLGRAIGEALAEGIGMGISGTLQELGQEVSPLVDAVLAHLRETLAASAGAEAVDQVLYATRTCEEPGCTEPSLARNLCRRHYARQLYQERKARLGSGVVSPRRRIASADLADRVLERKLAPVAPIIRRKSSTVAPAVEAVPAPFAAAPVMPAGEPANVTPLPLPQQPPPGSSVSVESVARFFGLNKSG